MAVRSGQKRTGVEIYCLKGIRGDLTSYSKEEPTFIEASRYIEVGQEEDGWSFELETWTTRPTKGGQECYNHFLRSSFSSASFRVILAFWICFLRPTSSFSFFRCGLLPLQCWSPFWLQGPEFWVRTQTLPKWPQCMASLNPRTQNSTADLPVSSI